ncbi:aldo/keto reductase [Pseudomonas sp. DCB_AW]|uniref:aldo/keto reductase n=1 Tax=Pseudomonas sp. DCB_AW TaxID=2993596 RepID=UPI002248F331|nr:aldo/keto reductase [Pseudomonas sp. DCB_AW]MCX2684682.1 aldo/keto reductase [Pseudomonas sp. DCB_AW]
MTTHQTLLLNDGEAIPQLGLGVWKVSKVDARLAVNHALRHGYRHIDTASIYGNEEGVGLGMQDAGLPRESVFITTKIWNADQGYDSTLRALEASLARLRLSTVDLLLVHWPAPGLGKYIDTWRALIEAQAQGKARSIGVSNFDESHLHTIINATGVKPALNQIELHPLLQQPCLRCAHAKLDIATQAWSPLSQGQTFNHPIVLGLAEKHWRTPAQIILRWHIQNGVIAIPKSITPARIEENIQVFDFALDEQDMAAIASMNIDKRLGPDPLQFTFPAGWSEVCELAQRRAGNAG